MSNLRTLDEIGAAAAALAGKQPPLSEAKIARLRFLISPPSLPKPRPLPDEPRIPQAA